MAKQIVKLTDKQIADLLISLKKQYEKLDKNLSFQEVYDTLGCALAAKIDNPDGEYFIFNNNSEEKNKIFEVLTTFVTSVPQIRGERRAEAPVERATDWFNNRNFAAQYPNRRLPEVTIIHNHYYYNRSSWFYDYWLYSRLLSLSDSPRNRRENKDCCKIIVCLMVAAAALAVLYVAMAYAWNTFLDSMDRMIHNEGRQQATIAVLGLMVGAVVGIGAGALFFAPVLCSAGLLGALCTISASAASGVGVAYMLNVLQDKCIKIANPDALDQNDPHRICFTESEIQSIKANAFDAKLPPIDPLKVKCAIAALRADMGDMPSATTRFFSKNCKAQKNLVLIRKLRNGELEQVQVGEYLYSLRKTQVAQNVEVVPSNNDDYNANVVWGSVVQ